MTDAETLLWLKRYAARVAALAATLPGPWGPSVAFNARRLVGELDWYERDMEARRLDAIALEKEQGR